jgi:hypothetical protein
MRRVPLLTLVAAATLARPIRLAAQAVERTDTPRRGALRVSFDPRIMTWEQLYAPGGRQRIGAGFNGDSVSQSLPSVVRLQQDVRAATDSLAIWRPSGTNCSPCAPNVASCRSDSSTESRVDSRSASRSRSCVQVRSCFGRTRWARTWERLAAP